MLLQPILTVASPFSPSPVPPQLVELVADPALSVLFSQAELAELLQFERGATVLHMRNREQQQQAGGEEGQADVAVVEGAAE